MDYNTYCSLRRAGLFILDMDGTLYLGDEIIPGAPEFTSWITESGRQLVYLTNNSSRAGGDYVKKLHRLGFPCGSGDIFTSGMATALYITKKYPGAAVYAVGTKALREELMEYGVNLVSDRPEIVLVGFDTELNYEKLDKACFFLRRGARYIATNPDRVCPLPEGEYLPDCGSICALIESASGRKPRYIGKPSPEMLLAAAGERGFSISETAVVGDRLYTDIAAGEAAGAVTVCVLSGETNREMISSSPITPDYIFPSVLELHSYLNFGTGL